MAEPIIIIRENGLVIEVDLTDEQLDPPQVTPASGKHQKYTIRWPKANYKHGTYQCKEEGDGNGGRQAKVWKVKGGGGEAGESAAS